MKNRKSTMLALFLVLYTFSNVLGEVDWCKDIACKNDHTMCKWPTASPAKACGDGGNQHLTVKEIEDLLHAHNSLRDHVAAGKETRAKDGKMPPAADMTLMVWNYQIAEVAERYARQCTFAHDRCRDIPGMKIGQNLFMGSITGYSGPPPPTNMTKNAQAWYLEEVKYYDTKHNKPFVFSSAAGHFTQYIWSRSNQLGCGYSGFLDDSGWYNYLLVCNYGAAGNYLGNHVYKEGEACSQCPDGTSCGVDPRYPHLCSPPKNKIPEIVEVSKAKDDHNPKMDDAEHLELDIDGQINAIKSGINAIKGAIDMLENSQFDDTSLIKHVTGMIRRATKKINTAADVIDETV